ncbi:peptidylprolyl isomerase [Halorutilales archaeon Cl-col2-1]
MAVEAGDTIRVEYTGRKTDGEVFDTSDEETARDNGVFDERRDYEPLEFEVGADEMIQGFDEGVVGMEEGETKEIDVPPEKGYGEYDDEMVVEYDYEDFQEMLDGAEPEVGMHVHAQGGAHGDVIEVDDDTVVVDFNHELAGEDLVFEVEVVGIN